LALFAVIAIAYAVVLFVLLQNYETQPAGVEVGKARDPTEIDRNYRLPLAAVFAYFVIVIASAGGVTVFIPEFINSTYGFSFSILGTDLTSESTASFYFSALLIIAGIAQLGTGRLADRYDERLVILTYVGVAGMALIGLATLVLSPVTLFLVLIVLGSTLYGMNPARDALVSHLTPDEREGRVFGYIWTGALLASAGAPVVVGYIGDVAGLRPAFLILAGGVLLSAVPIALLSTNLVPMPGPEPGGSRAD
jgi:MFS family permease